MDFYSDNDRHAAAWMRELIKAKHLPKGKVDERGIEELQGCDLSRFRRVHLFAGIGGWGYALELAGWPRSRPVWTGSCPCQPFSAAGKGKGEADERHLWPAWMALVRQCRPDCIFGEQVASHDGYRWIDGVRTDLEAEGYAVGAADLPAACVGAPHIRQRLFWCAAIGPATIAQSARRRRECGIDDSATGSRTEKIRSGPVRKKQRSAIDERLEPYFAIGHSSDANCDRLNQAPIGGIHDSKHHTEPCGGASDTRHARRVRRKTRIVDDAREGTESETRQAEGAGLRIGGGYWDAFDIVHYRDGKTRRVEPGTFPLAHGVPARMVKLRGYGNAINPQTAAAFIRAFLESEITRA